jgi:hypothetical protein
MLSYYFRIIDKTFAGKFADAELVLIDQEMWQAYKFNTAKY